MTKRHSAFITTKRHLAASRAFGAILAAMVMAAAAGSSALAQAPAAPAADATVQSMPMPTYTLPQTIGLALKSSGALQVAQKTIERDAAKVDEAAAGARPHIASQDSYQHLDSPVVIAFGPQSIVAEKQDKEFLTATASLPLDISGQIKATTDAARLQFMADRFERDRVYNERVLQAETTYFDLLRAEHQVKVAQSGLQNAQTQQSIAQRQFEGGVGQKIDALRAQSQTATAQQLLNAAQNNLTNAESAFNDLLGRPMDAPVAAVDTVGVSTGIAVGADTSETAAEVTAPAPTFYTPDLPPSADLPQGLQVAQSRRPELLADQVQIQAEDKQIAIARTGLAPSLSLSAAGDYYPVTDFQTPRHSLGIYSVNLTIPLYDGGVTRDRVKEAEASKDAAKAQFDSDQTNVELQVRQSYQNLQTASQQIGAANAGLQQAIAARQLAQIRYANGVGLYLEVTDAEAALILAETAQVNAVYDYLTARAQYENAMGAPVLNPQI